MAHCKLLQIALLFIFFANESCCSRVGYTLANMSSSTSIAATPYFKAFENARARIASLLNANLNEWDEGDEGDDEDRVLLKTVRQMLSRPEFNISSRSIVKYNSCPDLLNIWLGSLFQGKEWAFRVIDALGKPTSGLLQCMCSAFVFIYYLLSVLF